MAAVQPKTFPYYTTASGAGKPWLADYNQYTQATYALTSRDAFINLASKYYNKCLAVFAQMVAADKQNQEQLKNLREVLLPAATAALNNIAKSGQAQLIVDANKIKQSLDLKIGPSTPAIMTIKFGSETAPFDPISINGLSRIIIGVLKRADTDVQSVRTSLENIKNESVPAYGKTTGQDCGFWARIIYLFSVDFDSILEFFNIYNDKLKDLLAKAKAEVGSIFDIDDKVNGASSYRNQNKQLVAKEEWEEEQKQKKITATKAVFDSLIEASKSSPISSFIQHTLASILEAGNLYESVPAASTINPSDNLFLQLKKRQDNLLANVAAKKFDNVKNITDEDIDVLVSLNGNTYTEQELRKAISGTGFSAANYFPNQKIISAVAALRNINVSALSTNSTANTGGKTPAELQAEADAEKKKKEQEKLDAEKKALEEAKAKEDAAKIADLEKKLKETEQKIIDAAAATKEAEEKKKQKKELAAKLKSELPPPHHHHPQRLL